MSKLHKLKDYLFIFVVMFMFIVFWGLVEKRKIVEIEFLIAIALIYTTMFIIVDVTTGPIFIQKPTIIVKPPQWTYTYDALEEHLPDCLIREVMKFQYISDPKYIDFNIYRKKNEKKNTIIQSVELLRKYF